MRDTSRRASLRRLGAVGLLVGFALVPGVAAEETAPGRPSLAIELHESRLENGVRVLVVPREGSLSVAAGWSVRAGSAHDPPSAPGFAHLLEHLLWQGTATVGVRGREREIAWIEREENLLARLREQWRGEPATGGGSFDPETVAARAGLAVELERIRREAAALSVQGELALLYGRASAEDLRARTFEDFTMSSVLLPPEALELWFWLESDRLRDPVWRQLGRELRVVRQERREELAADPGRELEEAMRRRLWGNDPYGRPVAGPPETLELLSRQEIREHFADRYRPSRLTLALVGAVDSERAVRLAETYFGRLVTPAGPHRDAFPPPGPRPPAEAAIQVACEGRPRVTVAYPGLSFDDEDRPALELLVGVLGGRAGRLHRTLVLDGGAAWSAYALHRPLARAGELWFKAELRPGGHPDAVLAGWTRVVERLRREPVPHDELARARDRLRVETYRGLREPGELLSRLLVYDALGDGRQAIAPETAWGAVTPERMRDVAGRVFAHPGVVGTCPGSSR